jgi:hypothetical protein
LISECGCSKLPVAAAAAAAAAAAVVAVGKANISELASAAKSLLQQLDIREQPSSESHYYM